MAQQFTFMNQGVADFGDGVIHQSAATDHAQQAIDLNNDDHQLMTPSTFIEDSASTYSNIRRDGALFNDHRRLGVNGKGATLDSEWTAQTWRSKATKGDMHYLLEYAGLLTDEVRALKGIELTEHMVKVRKERAAMRALEADNVGATDLEEGGANDNEDTLFEDNASAEELGEGEIKENDDTLVEDNVEGPDQPTMRKHFPRMRLSRSEMQRNT